jgi:hypothetical protein
MLTIAIVVAIVVLSGAGDYTAYAMTHPPVSTDGRKFNVTDGSLKNDKNGILYTTSPEMRAVLVSGTDATVNIKFTYSGATKSVSKLGDGTVRSQFGIKLSAQDPCNLVYVMWRFAPEQGIYVSVKSNPDMTTSNQCQDNGYINGIPALVQNAVPAVKVGSTHTLQASLKGLELTVTADGVVAWQGTLPAVAGTFKGSVGVRSDNANVGFTFTAGN